MKWFLGALLALLAAYVFNMDLLAYATYALLGILLISRYVTKSWADNLDATRHCDRLSCTVGDTVTVMVSLTNRGRLPVAWCLVEDLLPADALIFRPPKLAVHGKRIDVMRIKGGERRQLLYQLTCNRRGYYQLGPLVLETGDLFGLHRRYRVISKPNFLLVLPRTVPLQGYDVASRRPVGEVRMTYRLYEDPTRIAGVRKYQRGDPLNRIHWRATARTGLLHSKIYEPSTIAGATLVLDFHQDAYSPKHEPFRSELAITAAASICNAVYEMGQQIGLVSNGRDAVDRIRVEGWAGDWRSRTEAQQSASMDASSDRLRPVVVPTKRGSQQLMSILEALARLELTGGLNLEALLIETTSRLPRDASVIVITSQITQEKVIALENLSRQGFAVTVILNLYEYEAFADAGGPLVAAGINIRHLRDEESIATICREHVLSQAAR